MILSRYSGIVRKLGDHLRSNVIGYLALGVAMTGTASAASVNTNSNGVSSLVGSHHVYRQQLSDGQAVNLQELPAGGVIDANATPFINDIPDIGTFSVSCNSNADAHVWWQNTSASSVEFNMSQDNNGQTLDVPPGQGEEIVGATQASTFELKSNGATPKLVFITITVLRDLLSPSHNCRFSAVASSDSLK